MQLWDFFRYRAREAGFREVRAAVFQEVLADQDFREDLDFQEDRDFRGGLDFREAGSPEHQAARDQGRSRHRRPRLRSSRRRCPFRRKPARSR